MKIKLLIFGITLFLLIPSVLANGCCSWHGGKDYCDTSTGRWVCKDGTYSPSCTCYIETESNTQVQESTNDTNTVEISDNSDSYDSYSSFAYYDSIKKEKSKNKDLEENTINNNSNEKILAIIIMIITYGFIIMTGILKTERKNKILLKVSEILTFLLSISFGCIGIPLLFGFNGHYILELLCLIVIGIIFSYSDSY